MSKGPVTFSSVSDMVLAECCMGCIYYRGLNGLGVLFTCLLVLLYLFLFKTNKQIKLPRNDTSHRDENWKILEWGCQEP